MLGRAAVDAKGTFPDATQKNLLGIAEYSLGVVRTLDGPVRKFVKIALIVCLTVMSVPAVLYLFVWYKTAEVDSFYKEHRLLGAMRDRQSASANDSAPAREALLRMVPMGTDREAVLAALRKEMGCRGIAGPINCQTLSPNVLGYKQWIVDLEFDADNHLTNAHVTIWNIFL